MSGEGPGRRESGSGGPERTQGMRTSLQPLHRQRDRGGYTVVELITAMAIAVIVSVIGFSGTRLFSRQLPVKTTASQLSHMCSTARSFAISGNTYYRVLIDLDNRNFWIDRSDDPATIGTDEWKPKVVSPEKVDPRVKIEGIAFGLNTTVQTTGIQSILFRPDGSADQEAHITIHQAADDPAIGTNIFTVRVYGPTGVNQVYPYQRI